MVKHRLYSNNLKNYLGSNYSYDELDASLGRYEELVEALGPKQEIVFSIKIDRPVVSFQDIHYDMSSLKLYIDDIEPGEGAYYQLFLGGMDIQEGLFYQGVDVLNGVFTPFSTGAPLNSLHLTLYTNTRGLFGVVRVVIDTYSLPKDLCTDIWFDRFYVPWKRFYKNGIQEGEIMFMEHGTGTILYNCMSSK
jgi:hypothetical protein